jgi:septal ring-binding cell division protein DamX
MAKAKAETTQAAQNEAQKATTYKLIGQRTKSKDEANSAIREAHKKGFRSAGLMVKGEEFVVLFGTYATSAAARANLEAVKAAGFEVEISNITE